MAALNRILNFKYQILRIHIKYLIFTIFILFFIFNFSYYANQYFVQQNYVTAYDWQYGYEKLMPEVTRIGENYKKIIVSNRPPMDQSYMFFLFYLKYSPSIYQKETKGDVSGGFEEIHKFGKYEFRQIGWVDEEISPETLFVGIPDDFSDDANIINTFFYPNKEPAMQITTQK